MTDQKRRYTKRKRAELEESTRLRITESAVELHGTLGPARTSITAVAEHAGVQRSTVYRHFPDEAALFTACSGHWAASNPLPDLGAWAAVGDRGERLHVALAEIYAYYGRAAGMLEKVLRDEPDVPIVGELMIGFRAYFAEALTTLLSGWPADGPSAERLKAALAHALAFSTWRSLTVEQGLGDAAAIDLMCRLAEACAAAATEPVAT